MEGLKKGGRKPGVPNVMTAEAREAFHMLLSDNLEKLQQWIDETAKTDQAKAFGMVMSLAVHCVPKVKAIEIRDHSNVPAFVINAPSQAWDCTECGHHNKGR